MHDHDDDSYNDRTYDQNVLYSKAGKSFIRLKTQANSGIGEKIFDHHPIAVPWSILIVLCFQIIFCIFRVV